MYIIIVNNSYKHIDYMLIFYNVSRKRSAAWSRQSCVTYDGKFSRPMTRMESTSIPERPQMQDPNLEKRPKTSALSKVNIYTLSKVNI